MAGEKVHVFDEQPVARRGAHHGPFASVPGPCIGRPTPEPSSSGSRLSTGGDPEKTVPHRDRLMRLPAPFDGAAEELLRLEHRFAGLDHLWTPGGVLPHRVRLEEALAADLARRSEPPPAEKRLVWDRSVHDSYADPGSPHHRTNARGDSLVWVDGGKGLALGTGKQPRGRSPFPRSSRSGDPEDGTGLALPQGQLRALPRLPRLGHLEDRHLLRDAARAREPRGAGSMRSRGSAAS